jgi:geranylgeranyl reductase family protein
MARVDADVVVVGAGPAGSATALRLARLGHAVTVVDRAHFPRSKPCGEYLNPAAVNALDRLDVLAAASAHGVALSGMFIAEPRGATVWTPFPAGRGLLVPRDRLDHTLLRAAANAGANVIEGFRVDAVQPGPQPEITGRHDGNKVKVHARLIIGADGMRSVVARRGGALTSAAHAHYTIGARFEDVGYSMPRGDLHLGRGWYAGAALYGGGAANVVAAVPIEMFRRARGDSAGLFDEACEAIPTLKRLMRRARRVSPFVSAGPLGYVRRRAVDEGLLLVGDAAGTVDPMTGEGIAMALRGAELAAAAADRALRNGDRSRDTLASYDHERVRAFTDAWTVSRLLQWIVRRPWLAAPLARGMLRDPSMAGSLLGVVSQIRPVSDVLSARFIIRVLARAT